MYKKILKVKYFPKSFKARKNGAKKISRGCSLLKFDNLKKRKALDIFC